MTNEERKAVRRKANLHTLGKAAVGILFVSAVAGLGLWMISWGLVWEKIFIICFTTALFTAAALVTGVHGELVKLYKKLFNKKG